ncbi:MAG: dihydropteroate synthase [Phycisphaerales bacterium JB064]
MAHQRAVALKRPRVVAILNATPDSFFDGGQLPDVNAALARARGAVHHGAAMLDVGGESTRPGAQRVSAEEQIARVVPIIEAVRRCEDAKVSSIPISVDTTLSAVARAAVEAGADAINDVSGASEDADLLRVAADMGAGMVLMHRGPAPPKDRYADEYEAEPHYEGGVVAAVCGNLAAQAERAMAAGVARDHLVIDPGLGFGKSVRQNMELLRATAELASLGLPVYIGASRKRFVGRVSIGGESEPAERLAGSIAVTVLSARHGAMLHRVHDVAQHVQALSVVDAWRAGSETGME